MINSPTCSCGSITVRNGDGYKCMNCGKDCTPDRTPAKKVIYEQRIYSNDDGVVIQRKTPINYSELVDGNIVKTGEDKFFVVGTMQMPLGNGQVATMQFNCDIPGATPAEAFAAFPAAFEAAKIKAEAELKAQIGSPKIIVPGSQGPGMPGGGGMPGPFNGHKRL